MNAQLRPLRPPKRRRDPKYKPDYKPNYVRAAALALGKTLIEYALLIRLHRPIGIWLLMWPALWALWMAGQGRPGQKLLLIYLAGIFVMRSAGCVINDYADRDFDRRVERTRDRPLAAKRVAPGEALVLFIVLGLVATWLAMQLDPLARLYAAAGGLLAVTYPWLKRYVYLPQFYLGAAFGSFAIALTITAMFAAGLVGLLALPVAEVMIAFAPGAVDAMMLLALALHLDPVYVGAHHLMRIFFVSMTMPLVARRSARVRKAPDAPKPPLPPFQD